MFGGFGGFGGFGDADGEVSCEDEGDGDSDVDASSGAGRRCGGIWSLEAEVLIKSVINYSL